MNGIDGFLGTRASIMLDVVFLAMFAVIPMLGLSIYLVKFRRQYLLHKWLQLGLGLVLLVAVAAFEVDMRFLTDWRQRAAASPYVGSSPTAWGWVDYSLAVHLVFAVSAAVLWVFVIVQALRKIPNPPRPCEYSRRHAFWAWLAALDMFFTALTGWIFYWLAFVATAA